MYACSKLGMPRCRPWIWKLALVNMCPPPLAASLYSGCGYLGTGTQANAAHVSQALRALAHTQLPAQDVLPYERELLFTCRR